MLHRLQYISQGERPIEQWDNISRALDAGCRWIQLRFKNATLSELLELGGRVSHLCRAYEAILIINDHAAVAEAVEADGVHLGLEDMPVARARAIMGPGKIIGGTANTLGDVLTRIEERCNYVGLGPYRFTTTKKQLSPVLGLGGYEAILDGLKSRGLSIPLYAIGGILLEDVPLLIAAGVDGIAVSGLVTHHPDAPLLLMQFDRLYQTYTDASVHHR